jgi:hypothetical protein
MIAGAALAAGSCSKDDIPTTPSAPFLFTDVAVSKSISPPTTNPLHPGVAYVARYTVNYTLDPDSDAQRSQLAVFAELASFDADTNFVAVIGTLSYTPQVLTAAGGSVSDSIAFTAPATGASFVYIVAGIGRRLNGTFSNYRFGPHWSIK